ncbi:MAG: sigma-70 family RNA polymerase sigma factor, partial [Acidimicrobiia bacterium]|nr:sigma-70 family RNA polymerase sigma factor [Acidimicrobiia bacterium]
VRRRKRRPEDRLPDDPDWVLPPTRGADEALAAEALPDDVQAALARLPEDFRAAVVLCDVAGRSYQEIGESLGIPVGTVRSRIHRGRAMLRKLLGPT